MVGTDIRKAIETEREIIILKSTLQSPKVRSREASSNSFLLLHESFVYLFMSGLITKDLSTGDDSFFFLFLKYFLASPMACGSSQAWD